MSDKTINRLVATGVFLAAAVVYFSTISVTVVFWDVGEFCAASRLLQIPHPPGSPLFILLARIASLIPFAHDIALRMHSVSAVGSALGVMFLYLSGVRIIEHFRGPVQNGLDRLVVYGSSAIGALALAYTSTYWDNSIEAEVYGMAMLFVSLCIWLTLLWSEKADERGNERYLLLVAYLLGLSTGVHILALLPTIPLLMIVYFRKYEVTRRTAIRFSLIALAIFFVIYPGIVQELPSFLDGEVMGMRSRLFPFVPLALIIAAGYGAYRSFRMEKKMLHLACLSFLFIGLGYTTYTQVLIRANVDNLPLKENTPDTMQRLTAYLTREQYGETPMFSGLSWNNDQQTYVETLFPRRWSLEAMHEPTRRNYSSDWDFFWRYQVNHMFTRYILWNFSGAEGEWQDAGWSARETWAIPLLLGIWGCYYQFKKDRRFWLVFFLLSIIMGIVLDLYQNQQDPQPRERDYFYVGAYYCIALWIGIGVVGLIDIVGRRIRSIGQMQMAASGLLALSALAVPVNLLRINWHENDRRGNYIAWDYSYNILQSCEKNAILFTNGDNDTFPLWYLQDVEGIRRDIRIVCLSLGNTPWYIHQLKDETPYGTPRVPLSLTDAQIDALRSIAWQPARKDLPVPKSVAERFGITGASSADSSVLNSGKISFMLSGVPFRSDMRMLRVQDILVYDIVNSNHWERPIYFAATCSPDAKIGLENYLWMDGLAFRLKPNRIPEQQSGIEYSIMSSNVLATDVTPSTTPQYGYIYRNLNNPDVHYDENVRHMVINYRFDFARLAAHAIDIEKDIPKAKDILVRMEKEIPIAVIPMTEIRLSSYLMGLFRQVGDTAHYEEYARLVESNARHTIETRSEDESDPFAPYRALLNIYDNRRDYRSALELLRDADSRYPGNPELANRIRMYEQRLNATTFPDTDKQQP